jgi:AcrR family transcriptional regulator
LTLEAVAQEAHLSKGGLRYHFPSKEALITGMIQDHLEAFEMALAHLQGSSSPEPGTWLRAYLCATYASPSRIWRVLLACWLPSRTILRYWNPCKGTTRPGKHMPNRMAFLLLVRPCRLALDGLWFAEMFGLAPPNPGLREQVEAFLLALIQESGVGP